MKTQVNLRYNQKKTTIPQAKPQETEAEIIDHPQEPEPKTTLAIRNPPAVQAALAIQIITIDINTIESHDKKEDDKSDSSPK